MTVRFRPLLALPDAAQLPAGEQLIAPPHPADAAVRLFAFREKTGLAAEDVIISPLLNHPLPFYPAAFPENHRRWVGVHPSALWHPLLWLPKRLTDRVRIASRDGESIESEEMWAVRVALELGRSGVYREDEGTWLDVLAHWGLDIDDPATVERVRAWLAGTPDDILDHIDLDEILVEKLEPNWAVDTAWAVTPRLISYALAVQSNALLDMAEQTREEIDAGELDDESANDAVDEIVMMGAWLFENTPEELRRDLDADAAPVARLDQITSMLSAIRRTYWTVLERAAAEASASATAAPDQSAAPEQDGDLDWN